MRSQGYFNKKKKLNKMLFFDHDVFFWGSDNSMGVAMDRPGYESVGQRRKKIIELLDAAKVPYEIKRGGRLIKIAGRVDFFTKKVWYSDRLTGLRYEGMQNLIAFLEEEGGKNG